MPSHLHRLLCATLLLLGLATPALAQAPGPASASPEPEADGETQALELGSLSPKPGQLAARLTPFADGLVREGTWSPVHLRLANGGDDIELVLRADSYGANFTRQTASRTIQLPQGGRKDALLYLPSSQPSGTGKVEVVGDRMRSGVIEYPTRFLAEEDVGIAVIGMDAKGIQGIRETWSYGVPSAKPIPHADSRRQVRTGVAPLDTLPDRALGWAAVNWAVWSEPDPSLMSQARLDALLGWVASGGHLLVTVTDSYPRIAGTALEQALPLRFSGVEDTDNLSRLFQALELPPPGPVTVPFARASLVEDDRHTEVFATLDGSPAWVVGSYGLGTVHVLTVDPSQAPFTRLATPEALWRKLLWLPESDQPPAAAMFATQQGFWDPTQKSPNMQGYWLAGPHDGTTPSARTRLTTLAAMDMVLSDDCLHFQGNLHPTLQDAWGPSTAESHESLLREVLSDIPGVAPLPLSWLILFAGTYLFVIGPLDYYVLRFLGKQPWTWVTFPIAIAFFSGVALLGTAYTKGSQAVMTRVEVVDVLPGTPYARGINWFGLFSASKSRVTVGSGFDEGTTRMLGDGGFMGEPVVASAEGSGELSYQAQTWSLAYGEVAWVGRMDGGRVEVEALEGDGYSVTSRLPMRLKDATLHIDGTSYPLGTLGPDASVVATPGEAEYFDSRTRRVLAMSADLLDTGMGGHLHQPMVIGRVDPPVDSLAIDGLSPNMDTVTVYRVPVRMNP